MLQNTSPLRQSWNEGSRYRDAEGAEPSSPSACQFRLVSRFACCEPLSLPKIRYSLNVDQNLQTVHSFFILRAICPIFSVRVYCISIDYHKILSVVTEKFEILGELHHGNPL